MEDNLDNIIKIGSKPFMIYMKSLELLLRKGKKKKIFIKARGKNITKAVDLAEASKNKFFKDLNISIVDVKIYTSKFKDKENIERNVSCIDIEINQK